MTNKDIQTVISSVLAEQRYIINTEKVLLPFLDKICNITLAGFFTDTVRASVINSIFSNYGVDDSSDQILDFFILMYHHIHNDIGLDHKLLTDEVKNQLNNNLAVLDSINLGIEDPDTHKEIDNVKYGDSYKPYSSDIIFMLAYYLRINRTYVNNMLKVGAYE